MPETAVARIRKIVEIAQELRNGKRFEITRLTRIKALCEDPNAAAQFAIYMARLTKKGMETAIRRISRILLPFDSKDPIYLRLERIDNQFIAYCSNNDKNWLSCGKLAFSVYDLIWIGLCAIWSFERTSYFGSFKEGTATLFNNFRIWQKEE